MHTDIPSTHIFPHLRVEFAKNIPYISSSVWHECWIHQEYLKHIFFRVARVLNSPRISQTYLLPCGTSVEFTKNTSNMSSSVLNECWIHQEYLKIIVHSCGISVEHTKNTSNISKTKYTCNTHFLSLPHECKTYWYTSKADVLLHHEW